MPRYVLICGCARSGTSAVANLLNRHPDIAIGMERYINYVNVGGAIRPEIFAPERFLSIQPGDTFYEDFSFFKGYEDIDVKYPRASIVGDKVPQYYLRYDEIFRSLPGVKVVFLLRNIFDVAASYKVRALRGRNWPAWRSVQSAIDEWNLSMRYTARQRARRQAIHLLPYERFLLERQGLGALSDFLEVDLSGLASEREAGERRQPGAAVQGKVLSALEAQQISLQADFDLYRKLIAGAASSKPSGRRLFGGLDSRRSRLRTSSA